MIYQPDTFINEIIPANAVFILSYYLTHTTVILNINDYIILLSLFWMHNIRYISIFSLININIFFSQFTPDKRMHTCATIVRLSMLMYVNLYLQMQVIDNILYTILKQFKLYPDLKCLIGPVNANVDFFLEHRFSKNITCV